MRGYWRTLLWSRSLGRPRGDAKEWPYWRCAELAIAGVSGYGGAVFPRADSYSFCEFGVAQGGGLERMAHYRDVLVRRLRIETPIVVRGFDTFEGLPAARKGDDGLPYAEGEYRGELRDVEKRMRRFRDVELVPGLFEETLPHYHETLAASPPIFVSVDCDWYSSTMDVFRELLPLVPHGSLWYFDDASVNFWSSLTGEMRAVREINGDGQYEFVEHPLWIETGQARHWRQVYRLAKC